MKSTVYIIIISLFWSALECMFVALLLRAFGVTLQWSPTTACAAACIVLMGVIAGFGSITVEEKRTC